MFKLAIAVSILLFTPFALTAQKGEVDSLKKIIEGKSNDTNRLAAIATLLAYLQQNECESYNLKMIALAEHQSQSSNTKIRKLGKQYAAEGYYNKGVFLSNRNKIDSALIAYKSAIDLYQTLEDEASVAYPKMNLAIIYTTKGDFSTALNLLYESLRINEKFKNKEAIADCNIHLGRLYHIQKMEDKALASTTIAYNIYKEINYNPGIVDALHKLSTIAKDLIMPKASIDYLKMNVAFINSLPEGEKQDYLEVYYSDKATIAAGQKNWDSAIYYNKKSVALAIETNKLFVLGPRYLSIAEGYKAKKDFTAALQFAKMAFDLSKRNNNLASMVASTYFLSNLYPEMKDYKKAYEMQSLFIVLNDSVHRVENTKNTVEQQLKYEYEKKEIKNASIQSEKNSKKNLLISMFLGLFLTTAIVTYFIVKNQQKKNIIQKQLTEFHKQKAMLAQMNPHFIFNAINSIQNFVLQNNSDEAYSYLTKFSKLIRLILHNSNKEILTLGEELEALNLYISLEQLRFSNSFKYKLIIENNINIDQVEIPTMLIQPYVENSIWHGLMNLDDGRDGILYLAISKKDDLLTIEVTDNGIGRKRSAEYKRNNNHNPLAMKITAERLEVMSQTTKANGVKVEIIDLYDVRENATGTKVVLHLPLNN